MRKPETLLEIYPFDQESGAFIIPARLLQYNDFFNPMELAEGNHLDWWVFMWEAVTVNFIEMAAYNLKIKRIKGLLKAKVTFKYSEPGY